MKIKLDRLLAGFFSAPCQLLLITLLLLASYLLFVHSLAQDELLDLNVYLHASRRLAAGLSIYEFVYQERAAGGEIFSLYYLYPPFLAALLRPLLGFTPETLRLLACLLSYICVIGTAVLLWELAGVSWLTEFGRLPRYTLALFFLICFEPIYLGISYGQVGALILLLLTLHLWLGFKGHTAWAGAVLGIAAAIKMSPALLLLVPLRYRQYRAVVAFFAAGCLSVLATITLSGSWLSIADFAANFSWVASGEKMHHYVLNFPLQKTILAPLGLATSAAAAFCLQLAVLAPPLIFMLRTHKADPLTILRGQALLLISMVLLAPTLWFHHLAWLVLPLFVAILPELQGEARLKHLTRVLGIYFLLSQSMLIQVFTFRLAPRFVDAAGLVPILCALALMLIIWRWPPAAQHCSPQP